MAEKVDLSLDDIIKMNKKQTAGQRGNKKQPSKPNLNRLKGLGARSGITRKGGPKQTVTRASQRTVPAKKDTTMLHVSNLHYNVVNDDLKELFSDIGPIKKAAVHYDKSGRSLGTAEVIFSTREAAIRSKEHYDGVPLDGRPLNITIVPSQSSANSPTKNRIGLKAGSGIYKRLPTRNSKGGQTTKGRPQAARTGGKPNPQQRGPRQPRKQLTAEQLDADLAAYKMNVD